MWSLHLVEAQYLMWKIHVNEPNKTKTSEDALRSDHQTHQLLQQGIRDRAGALNHLMTNKRDNSINHWGTDTLVWDKVRRSALGGTCSEVVSRFESTYPELLVVIKFGNLPEIWQKCIIGGI